MARVRIAIRRETERSLLEAAGLPSNSDLDPFLNELIINYRRQMLRKTSRILRRRMKNKGLTLADLLK